MRKLLRRRQAGSVRQACLELSYHDDDQDVAPALVRVRGLLDELEPDLLAHIDAEDGQIIPDAAAQLGPEDQMTLVVKMVAHAPVWLGSRLLPWMVASITRGHRIRLLQAWSVSMPPAVFQTKVRMIRDGAGAALWTDLVAEVPALARMG